MNGLTLQIVGTPERRVFGLRSDAALARQIERIVPLAPATLVIAADVAIQSPTLSWLVAHPGIVLTDDTGAAVAGIVAPELAADLALAIDQKRRPDPPLGVVEAGGSTFVRSLRRRERLETLDLRAVPVALAERTLFDGVYKGVTDAVTKYVWPTPAFHVVRLLARWGVRPNAVTIVGIALTFLAAWAFARGAFGWAFAAAWLMTFLDTVDGKLARVTHTSSRIGDWLDHGTDWIHPPIWWSCLAIGLVATTGMDPTLCWWCCAVILIGYFAGRISEGVFKKTFGFNQHIWRPFDASLRLVIARRNPNLVILNTGWLLGEIDAAYAAVALWTVATIGLQLQGLFAAIGVRRRGTIVATYLEAAG